MKPDDSQFMPIEQNPSILKHIIKESTDDSLESPLPKAKVDILYKCRLNDYTVVDECESLENPFSFEVDQEGIIKGLNIGIQTMKIGERAVFKIPPIYAYGEQGSGKIPGNETLHFEAELLKIIQPEPELTQQEKIDKSNKLKEEGNSLFKQAKLDEALKSYQQALDVLDSDDEENEGTKDLLINLHNNRALLFIKKKQYKDALREIENTLDIDEKNVKALLRKGKVWSCLEQFEDALMVYEKILTILPDDKETLKEIQFVKKSQKSYQQKQKNIFAKMFQGPLYEHPADLENDPENPKVWLSLQIGENEPQKIVISLFKKVVPKTVDNFLRLCKGEIQGEENLHYKDSIFHRLIPDFMIQGGDFTAHNGTGGKSVYGEMFNDENFNVPHKGRGYLSMANRGPNTNGSQFFILFKETPHLNGKHCVFGKVVENMQLLDVLEQIETENDKPIEEIKIVDCGVCEQQIIIQNIIPHPNRLN